MHTNLTDRLSELTAHPDICKSLGDALERHSGARYYRCALQLNPFGYVERHDHPSGYASEADYNAAIVEACIDNGVDVAAITDHFRYDQSASLAKLLDENGIFVFPAFEANSSEGIHLLCLFPLDCDEMLMQQYIGACDVKNLDDPSPQSEKSAIQIADIVHERGGVTIAAHVCSASGLLKVLSGQARAKVWKSKHIAAAAIAGSPDGTPDEYRNIVLNKDSKTKCENPPALINASDISDPTKVSLPGATTLIKMTDVSIEGLRQAFLDSKSRIRLNSESPSKDHTEILAVCWDGGLLDGQCIRLNEALNVLIGGRGSGKSTVVESLRYVFDLTPRGAEALRNHKAIVKDVIRPGTEISVLVHSPHPHPQYYLIHRIHGHSPRVYDEVGELLSDLDPHVIVGDLEIYGQHEISELTRDPSEIADILKRFVPFAETDSETELELHSKLDNSQDDILESLDELEKLERALAKLPELREKHKRYTKAGLGEKIKSKTLLDDESRVFNDISERTETLKAVAENLVDEEFFYDILPEDYEKELPNAELIGQLGEVQDQLIHAANRAKDYLFAKTDRCAEQISEIEKKWEDAKKDIEREYTATLKALSKQGFDGEDFRTIQNQIKKIEPKVKTKKSVVKKLSELRKSREELLASLESASAKQLRKLKSAAKKVGRRLVGKVKVEVRPASSLQSLEDIIREYTTGNIKQAIDKLAERDALNLRALASEIRSGVDALQSKYGFTPSAAEKIAQGGEALALAVEQHTLQPEAILSLNVGVSEKENWKTIDQLSTGQKATAVLLLLLLESDAPVIIDQPEDDLDNRFIVGSVVSAIRDEKRERQFLFSSHNANIPVLGDAEQIVGLVPEVVDDAEIVFVKEELCGSIDAPEVKELVKDLLEGGKEAFQLRREKYGFQRG